MNIYCHIYICLYIYIFAIHASMQEYLRRKFLYNYLIWATLHIRGEFYNATSSLIKTGDKKWGHKYRRGFSLSTRAYRRSANFQIKSRLMANSFSIFMHTHYIHIPGKEKRKTSERILYFFYIHIQRKKEKMEKRV